MMRSLDCLVVALVVYFRLSDAAPQQHVFGVASHDSDRSTATASSSSSASASSSETVSLSLRQALHISTADRSLPILHRHYDALDLTIMELGGYDTSHSLESIPTSTWRASSPAAFQAKRWSTFNSKRYRLSGVLPTPEEYMIDQLANTFEWEEVELRTPNTSHVGTLATLGKMANNAYDPADGLSWPDLKKKWNISDSFGWLEDGLRGHVFADPTNSTVVVALKGTSAAFIGGGGKTTKNDKINDNLLFSCCCARVDWSWSTVCDCYNGTYTCQQDCLEHAVMTKSAYYPAATDLFNNITALYPHAQIWLTGHSLGGSLASMLSRTYAVPSVSFEAPGDLLPSRRLHLPIPPPPSKLTKTDNPKEITTHVYHTADPIPMGVCTGTLSTCGVAGFALESRCHTGESIIYDTVGRLGWSVDIRTHSIKPIIERVLTQEWGVTDEQRRREEEEEGRRQRCEEDRRRRKPNGVLDAMRKTTKWGWWPLPGGGDKNKDKDECDQEPAPKEPDDGQHDGRGVPDATREDDGECVDCFKWDFV